MGSPLISKKEEELPATREDFMKMKAAFDQLGYDVHTRQNEDATVNSVDDLMKRISSALSQYGGDTCTDKLDKKVIIFAFSGHGDKDTLYVHDGSLSLSGDILTYFFNHNDVVFEIPKLFFIDACRGENELKRAMKRVDYVEDEGNYRFDYATIPDYVSYCHPKWMVRFAEMLIDPVEGDDSLQNISAKVKRDIFEVDKGEKEHLQQCESMDRLNTGPIKLFSKKE